MAIMTMRQRKQKLADAELDFELDRVRARKSTLKRRFKYGPSTDRDLDQVRAMRARLSHSTAAHRFDVATLPPKCSAAMAGPNFKR